MAKLSTPTSFIATVNAMQARYFYETLLGLTCVSDDPFALVFKTGVTTLRIQKVDTMPATNHTVLGWDVADLKSCVETLADNGVRFEQYEQLSQDELGIWKSPSGASIAWFKDPDGNTLSLTEH